MRLEIQIDEGLAAQERFGNPEFVQAWTQLYEACPWGTAGQRPEFVRIWYRHYAEVHPPVLVTAYAPVPGDASDPAASPPTRRLIGVLPLARSEGGLIYGGHPDAEYQVWLAEPTYADAFILQALLALDRVLGRLDLKLAYLPAGTPVAALGKWTGPGARCLVRELQTPLVVTTPEAIEAFVQSKKNARARASRLRRRRNLVFRRYQTDEEIEAALEVFMPMFDFRRGSMKNVTVFRRDPRKKPFLLDLARAGLVHFTGVEFDEGTLVAAHLTSGDARRLVIGGIVHTDFEARFSPGTALLYELVQLMAKEGYRLLDLTPGGESYKDLFAERSEPAYTLDRPAHRRTREHARLRAVAKRLKSRFLEALPAPTRARAEAALQKALGRPARAPAAEPARIRGRAVSLGAAPAAPSPTDSSPSPARRAWHRNDLGDLVRFSADEGPYYAFLRTAAALARAGATSLTTTENDQLRQAWFLLPADAIAEFVELAPGSAEIPGEGHLLLALPQPGVKPSASGVTDHGDDPTEVLAQLQPSERAACYLLDPY